MINSVNLVDLAEILQLDLLDFKKNNYKGHDVVFNGAMTLFYLVKKYYDGEDKSDSIVSRIKEHVILICSGGHEPHFDAGAFHSYVPTSASICMIKDCDLWNEFDAETHARLDLIMEMFVYLGVFCTRRTNAYSMGPGMRRKFYRGFPNNISLTVFAPMIFAGKYFGADGVEDLLASFDYDSVTRRLKQAGFTRTLEIWPEDGGNGRDTSFEELRGDTLKQVCTSTSDPVFRYSYKDGQAIGKGVGIRIGYGIPDEFGAKDETSGAPVFYNLQNIEDFAAYLVRRVFCAGEIKNEVELAEYDHPYLRREKEYVLDQDGERVVASIMPTRETNPALGKPGMIQEFDFNNRSDMTYCYLDFSMATVIISACESMGICNKEHPVWGECVQLAKNGSEDLLFKDSVGYIGYNTWANDFAPVERKNCDYAFFKIAKSLYNEYVK